VTENKDDEQVPRRAGYAPDDAASGGKKAQALAHLAFLQRELLEAEAATAKRLHLDELIEANQQLVLRALSTEGQDHAREALPHLDTLPGLYLELREANESLVLSSLQAQKLQLQAEQALARQTTVLATVAHEMRNPLTPISLLAERIASVPAEKLPKMCALIEGQVQRLSRMVEDLLDVSRANTGKLRLSYTATDLGQVLTEVIEASSPLMATHHLRFDVVVPGEPLLIYGDAVRLAQVFTNVLTNAVKYTPSGGNVRLIAAVVSDTLHVTVADDGIGISPQALPLIFEPYVQDSHAVDFNASGLGIGLTVVRELVHAHAGTVNAESAGEGKGSQFTIRLPLLARRGQASPEA